MKKLKYSLFGIFIIGILYLIYSVTYIFIEPKAYDFMTKYVVTEKLPFDNTKNVYGHDDIVLVVIDDSTVQKYRWPWKRDLYSKIYSYFKEYAKPKMLVGDSIVFSLDTDNPEADKKLFDTLKDYEDVVVAFLPSISPYKDEKFGEEYDEKFIKKYSYKGTVKYASDPYFYESIAPFPQPYFDAVKHVGSAFTLQGFIDGNLERYARDQIDRNQEYFLYYKGNLLPSIAMEVFLLVNNSPEVIIDKNYIIFPDLNYKIKQKVTEYQMIVPRKYYKQKPRSPYSHTKYSALDIINSFDNLKTGKKADINPEIFKDKIVVFGAYVTGGESLNDNKSSPISVKHPGVDLQATSIDNIMHNDFLTILPKWFNAFLTILGMLFIYCIINTKTLLKAINYSILSAFTYFMLATVCYYYGIIINVSVPIVMFIVTMIIGYIHRYVIENRNKEKVKAAMGKYMSEDVMKNVIKNIDNLGLGGKKAVVTVLFSDIRGFTSLSESMSAQQVSELLNEYFSEMEPIVSRYNGIINKFIGDAVMAVFGEPIQDEKHPLNAVKCGLEMLQKVKELDKKWKEQGRPEINIGVGINTGEVFVGNIGSEKRMEYTVIGDTVNLASRLESYNKTYKTSILISSSTYEHSKDCINVNKISDVEIRGKAHKMDIYEVTEIIR